MKTKWWIALAALCFAPCLAVAQQNTPEALKKLPGYVDFDPSTLFAGKVPTVQINLEGPLLQAMTGMLGEGDKDFADMVKKISLVRVFVYENLGEEAAKAADKIQALVTSLESGGWTRAISINDGGSVVRIFSKLDGENIAGLTVVVYDPGGEVVFVNVVGSLSPSEIGALMSKVSEGDFEFPGMDEIGSESEKDDDAEEGAPAEDATSPETTAPSTP